MANTGFTSNNTLHFDRAAIPLTRHAGIRVQQRGVQVELLDCLLAYGHHQPDHKGCDVVTFDDKALQALCSAEPQSIQAKVRDARNLYAVIDSDGIVITAGHRFRRVPRDLSQSALRPGRSRSPRVLHAPTNPFFH